MKYSYPLKVKGFDQPFGASFMAGQHTWNHQFWLVNLPHPPPSEISDFIGRRPIFFWGIPMVKKL